jgi:hypothetical protein
MQKTAMPDVPAYLPETDLRYFTDEFFQKNQGFFPIQNLFPGNSA